MAFVDSKVSFERGFFQRILCLEVRVAQVRLTEDRVDFKKVSIAQFKQALSFKDIDFVVLEKWPNPLNVEQSDTYRAVFDHA